MDGVQSSSDEYQHFHGTTSDGLATFEYIRVEDYVIFGSLVDSTEGKVYQFSADAEGNEVVTIISSNEFADEDSDVDDEVESEVSIDTDISGFLRGSANSSIIVEKDGDFNDSTIHTIRVLVVWTKQAECRNSKMKGNCTPTRRTFLNMVCLVALAVSETNTAYSLSGVNARLKLVHQYRHPSYKEPVSKKIRTMRGQLRDEDDGNLDDVHSKRCKYKADVVAMIARGNRTETCGIAYFGPGRRENFSVTQYECATGYYSFGHEIGHNFGCSHDRGQLNECSSSGYNYGWRDPKAKFRTIMAYNCNATQCDGNAGGGCTRIQRFSHRTKKFFGPRLGDSKNDNVRHMNEKAYKMANTDFCIPPSSGGGGGGGSCVAGNTVVVVGSEPKVTTKVMDLAVGDTVQGFDSEMNPTECKVEAIGKFGEGPIYGGYTDDHYIYNPATNMVEEHGNEGDYSLDDRYDLIADCPLIEDGKGTRFGAFDSDFCGGDLGALSWKDYVLLHSGILTIVRASGGFWFDLSAYVNMDSVRTYGPSVCSSMLSCMKAKTREACSEFETASSEFISNAVALEYDTVANSAFPKLGAGCEIGSASLTLMGGADNGSDCSPLCPETGVQFCVPGSPQLYNVCDESLNLVEMGTAPGTKCCEDPNDATKVVLQHVDMECPST